MMAARALAGMDVVVAAYRTTRRGTVIGTEPTNGIRVTPVDPTPPAQPPGAEPVPAGTPPDIDPPTHADDNYLAAVNELLGAFDISSLLSSFGGAGVDNQKATAEALRLQAEKDHERQVREAEARKRTALWVTLAVVGAALLGGGVFFATRKRR